MTKPRRSRSHLRLVVRVLLWSAAVVALAVGGGFWIATRSWFIIHQATPVLAQRLGGDVTIARARYLGRGFFEFDDVVLRVPDLEGDAGEVAHIGLVSVEVDPDLLLRGGVEVERIGLENVELRISEDSNDSGTFNFMGLNPKWDPKARATSLPSRISIQNCVLQMGVHVRGGYAERGRRRVSGVMQTLRGEDQWYQFLMHEIDADTFERVDGGLTIGGRWNATTYEYEAQVNAIVLDDRSADMCPQNVRLWWEKMQPEGRVANAKLRWSPPLGMSLELDLDLFALTFPIEAEDLWVRYRDGGIEAKRGLPRMQVRSGRLFIDSNSLEFRDLVGVLDSATTDDDIVGVPYRVSARLGSLSSFSWENRDTWMEQVIATAPFSLHLMLDDFGLSSGPDGNGQAVELPLAIARVLQTFRMTGWNLSTEIEVRRDSPRVAPETGELIAGDTFTWGEACIQRGSGAYERFPYRLDDITAHIEFDDDFVKLHNIHGYGAGDAIVEVDGEIRSLHYGDVSVHVMAQDIELDARLRDALRPGPQLAFDAFLSRSAQAALEESGLLVDPEFTGKIAHAAPPAGGAWPFRLGGRVNLDLMLTRDGGYESPTVPTGRLDINRIGVLYEGFPYPVTVTDGSVIWETDRLRFVSADGTDPEAGLSLLTPGGGEGTISGEVLLDVVDGETVLRPAVRVDLHHDRLNDLLYAAVPLTADEQERLGDDTGWPGRTRTRVADYLRQVFRSGELSYHGTVFTDPQNGLDYDFQVELRNASARPTADFASVIGAPQVPWPDGFGIDDGAGDLRITPRGIELQRFTARHGTGAITASGTVVPDDTGELQTQLHVNFDQLHLGPYLLNIVPDQWSDRANDLWSRYRPEGKFRAELDLDRSAGNGSELAIRLTPEELNLVVNDQPMQLLRKSGHLLLQRGRVSPRNLSLDAWVGGQPGGRFEINERPGVADGSGSPTLELAWRNGAFESPLVLEAMRLTGSAALINEYQSLQPFGEFDARVEHSPRDAFGRGGYLLALQPRSLGVQVKDTPILAQFEAGSEIRFRDGVLSLQQVRARHGGGSVSLDGTVDMNGALAIDVDLASEGPLRGDEVWAVLPETVRSLLDGIAYQDGELARLADGHLRMSLDDAMDGQRRWRLGFDGRLETRGASMDVGLAFRDVNAVFDVSIARDPGQAPRVEVDVRAESLQAGRDRMTNVVAPIRLTSDGRSVVIPKFRAEFYGGALAADLTVGIHSNPDYDLKIDVVGASLNDLYSQLSADASGQPSDESDGPSGTIFANVAVSGQRGYNNRIGRGALRIMDGRFAKVLFSLRMMQMLQLTLPLQHDYFDFAKLDFYLENDRIVFDDEILLESGLGDIASLQLLGRGWMDAESFEMNTRFRVRTGVLLLRDLAGGLSDGLFLIELTGPIFEPNVNIIPLPGIAAGDSPEAASSRLPKAPTPAGQDEAESVIAAGERPGEE